MIEFSFYYFRSITEFISKDLKKSQEFIAGGIVDLLLMVVVKDPEDFDDVIDEEVSLEVEKKASEGAIPVVMKSFSFS